MNTATSLTTIGNSAFQGSGLTSIIIPGNVSTIGLNAFTDSTNLGTVTFLGNYNVNFSNTAFDNIANPSTAVYNYDAYPLYESSDYIHFFTFHTFKPADSDFIYLNTADNNLTLIGFVGAATKIYEIPATLTHDGTTYTINAIDTNAFIGSSVITGIIIPATVTTINASAFNNCPNLNTILFKGDYNNAGFSQNSFTSIGESRTGIFKLSAYGAYLDFNFISLFVNILVTDNDIQLAYSLGSSDTTASVARLLGTSTGSYTIPSTLELTNLPTYTVTSIIPSAFLSETRITGITIPSTIITIGSSAFQGTAITGVIIPPAVTSIGASAFANCTSLIRVEFLGNYNAGFSNTAFSNIGTPNTGVYDLVYTGYETSGYIHQFTYHTFSDGTFSYTNTSDSVASVTGFTGTTTGTYTLPGSYFHNGITYTINTIASGAFSGKTVITGMTISSGITTIQTNAFQGCTALELVVIPVSTTSIGDNAFSGCSGLGRVRFLGNYNVGYSNTAFPGSPKPNAIQHYIVDTGYAASNYTSNFIVEQFMYQSFVYQARDLSANVVDFIGTGVTDYTMPNTITFNSTTRIIDRIGNGAFLGKTNISSIIFAPEITHIGISSFQGCTGLTRIILPRYVTLIGDNAFSDCTQLTFVRFIGDYNANFSMSAFLNIGNPSMCVFKREFTGYETSGYNELFDLTQFSDGTFLYTTIDSTATVEGLDVTATADYVIPAIFVKNDIVFTIRAIRELAFENESAITGITIPAGVTSIGYEAFLDCANLVTVRFLGDYNTNFSPSAFLNIGGGRPTTIYYNTVYPEFENSGYINTFTFSVFNKGAFSYRKTLNLDATIVEFYGILSEYIIPSIVVNNNRTHNVIAIGENSFTNINTLINLTIPSSVRTIEPRAFVNCSSMNSVNFANGVTSMGDSAFQNCQNIRLLNIPSSVTVLGNSIFQGCSKLARITIPNSLSNIGANAFQSCSSLSGVNIPTTLSNIRASTFQHCTSLDAIVFPTSVTSIGGNAFGNCSLLSEVTIPSQVTTIGNGAFKNCTNIGNVYFIGDKSANFASNAFDNIKTSSRIHYNITYTGYNTYTPSATRLPFTLLPIVADIPAVNGYTITPTTCVVDFPLISEYAPITYVVPSLGFSQTIANATSITLTGLAPSTEYYRDMTISLNGYLLQTPALFFNTLNPPPREDFQMTVIPNQQPGVFTNNAGIYYKIHSLPTGGAKTSKNARYIGSRT
jgi:hypothetical protein